MAKLIITNFNANSLDWQLTDLDQFYNRDDRLVYFEIWENNNTIVATNSNNLRDSKTEKIEKPWEYKNNLYSLPKNIYKNVGRTWVHGANLKTNSNITYTVKCYIFWSVQSLENSDWVATSQVNKSDLIKYFPCYPNFNLGPVEVSLGEFQNIFKNEEINDYYNDAQEKLSTIPQQIQYINERMAAKAFPKIKDKSTESILQWFPFPSGAEIHQAKGAFDLEAWYNKKIYGKNLYTIEEVKDLIVNKNTKTEFESVKTIDWGYKENFLYPSENEQVVTSATTQYKALFPPILESYQPAFVGANNSSYEIFFRLSNYTNIEDVAHVDVRISLQSNGASVVDSAVWPDQIIYKVRKKRRDKTSEIKTYGNGLYSVIIYANQNSKDENRLADLISGHWENNAYYKVQMRLGTAWTGWATTSEYYTWRETQIQAGHFSEWSTVMLLKAIPQPTLKFKNNEALTKTENKIVSEYSTSPAFVVNYSKGDENSDETVDKYKFLLYSSTNELLEESEWIQYRTNSVVSDISVDITHYFKQILEQGKTYRTIVKIITKNLYEATAEYRFKVLDVLDTEILTFPENIELNATTDEDNGIIKLQLKNNDEKITFTPYCNLILTRQKNGETFQETMLTINHLGFSLKPKTEKEIYTDFTVESGVSYKYFLYLENSYGQRGQPLESLGLIVYFEDCFLFYQGKQLRIRYNPQINSYKNTVLATKQDTLGGKYPVILQNGASRYAEFPLGGLISLHSEYDGFSYFFNKDLNSSDNDENKYARELYEKTNKPFIKSTEKQNKENFNLNLTSNNMYLEKEYRKAVEEFLNDGNQKLFRSPSEGNHIIGLINVSLTPNQQLGRMISSFTSQAYELADFSIENLIKNKILTTELSFNSSNNSIKKIKQIVGVFKGNILDNIKKDIPEGEYSFNKLVNFCLEVYPKVQFENMVNYYLSKEDFENKEEIEAMSEAYKGVDKYQYIKLQIIRNGILEYDGFIPTDTKFYSPDLNLLDNDELMIANGVPVILTYTLEEAPILKEERVDEAYEITGYKQLYGIFVNENSTFYLKNKPLFQNGKCPYSYYSSKNNNIKFLILCQCLYDLELSENYHFDYSKIENDRYLDDIYSIEIEDIPWMDIQAAEGTKIKIGNSDTIVENNDTIIGPSGRIIFENIENISFNETETQALINYAYRISIVKRGK